VLFVSISRIVQGRKNAMQAKTLDKTIKARDESMTEVERLMEAIAEAVKNEISASKRANEQNRCSTGDLVKDTEHQIPQRPVSPA
jgi:hypothetical protein